MIKEYCSVSWMFFLLLPLLLFLSFSANGQSQPGKIECICIDAGHGGRDPGAVKGKIMEKDITLMIVKKLGNLIQNRYPDMKIVYTRERDVAVDLRERGRIANRAKAQLFISVHVNNFKNPSVSGVETYVLGLHKSETSLQVAMKENEAIHYEKDYSVKYEGFDPNQAESYIMFNYLKSAYLLNSMELALPVQRELVKSLKTTNRQVRQAGFIVLMDVAMPAVLIETGFLSNANDRKFLTSVDGQDKMAEAIFKGFVEYKDRVESNSVVIKNIPDVVKGEEKQNDKEFFYAIQVASTTSRITDLKLFKLNEKIEELALEGRYCYYVYRCSSYEEALKQQRNIKGIINDCFIIAIYNGEIISVTEAKKMENNK